MTQMQPEPAPIEAGATMQERPERRLGTRIIRAASLPMAGVLVLALGGAGSVLWSDGPALTLVEAPAARLAVAEPAPRLVPEAVLALWVERRSLIAGDVEVAAPDGLVGVMLVAPEAGQPAAGTVPVPTPRPSLRQRGRGETETAELVGRAAVALAGRGAVVRPAHHHGAVATDTPVGYPGRTARVRPPLERQTGSGGGGGDGLSGLVDGMAMTATGSAALVTAASCEPAAPAIRGGGPRPL